MKKNIARFLVPRFLLNWRRAILNQPLAFSIDVHAEERKFRILISSGKPVLLEFGAGSENVHPGWTGIDIRKGCAIQWDILSGFPIPDESVDKIYSSHFLEHFSNQELKKILSECHRVLKPGGWISACVPDASIYIKAYSQGQELDTEKYCGYKPAFDYHSRIDYVNYVAYLGGEHKHLFDQENLIAIFVAHDFKNARKRSFMEELDLKSRDYQSIYVEANK